MEKRISYLRIFIVLFLITTTLQNKAQTVENEFQTRTEIKLTYKPIKNVKLIFTPELRFNDKLNFDQYLIEGELNYTPLKVLNFGVSYRYIANKTGSGDYSNRNKYALYIEADKKISRFKPSVKLSFTNSADDVLNSQFLRYKAGVEYNIRKCKLTPEIKFEIFHDLDGNSIYKYRSMAGLNYKLSKKSSIALSYKFDYYMNEYRNKHIASVGYKYKF